MAIRSSFKNFWRALKAPWVVAWGTTATSQSNYLSQDQNIDYAVSNNFPWKAQTFAQDDDVEGFRIDADNLPRVGGEGVVPMPTTLNFAISSLTGTPTQAFFVVPAGFPQMYVTGVAASYGTTNGAALTATITHESSLSTTSGLLPAPGAGKAIHAGSINLNTTINTPQQLVLPKRWGIAPGMPSGPASTTPSWNVLVLNPGDTLSILFSGAVTSLANLVVSVDVLPGAKGVLATYNMATNGNIQTQTFFSANRTYTVQGGTAIWSVAGTNASAVTLAVTIDTGTAAPGAGTTILSSTVNLKGPANTPNQLALTATAANLNLAIGNRLAVLFTGTLTSLAGMVVVVWLKPGSNVGNQLLADTNRRKEVTCDLGSNAIQGTQPFWGPSPCDFEVVDASAIFGTAAGGVLTANITVDPPGTAPGSGTAISGTAFNLNATANTTQFLVPSTTLSNRIVPTGAYLSLALTAAKQSLANLTVTVTLRPQS